MGGSPGITELMARLLREVEGGSAVRARFVGDGVSASGRGLCGREAPGWLRRGACSAGCCASGRVRPGRAVRRKGLRRGLLAREERKRARRERCGPQGREGEVGRCWVDLGRVLGFGWFSFSKTSFLLFLIQTSLNSNANLNSNHTQLKVCTSMYAQQNLNL